mmetsp:Transcript_6899/g.10680  ORF Transcript_6899/g.10680 Transcript_6899/m.10680 type:complete len:155 (-) Transcript_6899:326-790(-)|eukprot:CAMPEP_0175105214 /NCGR_PEP_ID=MMETSP0086_2-20121207/10286_1 /TAXON_ID=136419 /ORGANISM="Unknown Unknown, Strain D1" /LENGTH=154 /DNA_ID=CAMNT_0016380947 /DNA_START=27 /DNA_END=491 /DNA_ORIENTATION=-
MATTIKCSVVLVGGKVQGCLSLEQKATGGETTIKGKITGLTNGLHGLHVCQFGDLSNDGAGCGDIFNPFGKNHGGPEDRERMIGDLGNVESKDGSATVDISDALVSLIGVHSVIGRSIVVRASEDDLGQGNHPDSITIGHSGAVVGCGVVGIAR